MFLLLHPAALLIICSSTITTNNRGIARAATSAGAFERFHWGYLDAPRIPIQ